MALDVDAGREQQIDAALDAVVGETLACEATLMAQIVKNKK